MAQKGDETILEEAKDLLVRGKRFMALADYQAATDLLEQSVQLLDAVYGVGNRECADAYYEYGLALVAMANLEAGAGSDKLMKKAGSEDDDEDADDEEAEDDEEEEGGEEEEDEGEGDENGVEDAAMNGESKTDENGLSGNNNAENNGATTNGQVPMEISQEPKTNGVETQNKPQASSSSSSAPEPTPGTSAGDEGQEDEEAEKPATTIEIAWEVLCLAKNVFMTDESLEGRLKYAQTLHKIGYISIEWDNNDNAVGLLEECLKVRQAILKPDDREIAETYHHLALAHFYKNDTQKANENFQNAINVIEKRITSISEDLEKAKAAQDTVAIGLYQKEINELKELLPDMRMRMDDSKEDETKTTEVLKRTREEMQQEDEEVVKVCSDKSKPVDDISHLVKRKAA